MKNGIALQNAEQRSFVSAFAEISTRSLLFPADGVRQHLYG